MTSRIAEMIGVEEFDGTAIIYSEDQARLVVQTNARWHQAITRHLESHLIWNLRTEISIYEKQGVSWTTPELLSLNAPADADLITSLSWIHLPGGPADAKSDTGDLAVVIESQIDGNYEYAVTTSPEQDPFAVEKEEKDRGPHYKILPPELRAYGKTQLYDLRDVLEKNGVSFRPGDFAALDQNIDLVYAKVSEVELELIDGILNSVIGQGPPRDYSLHLSEIEWDDTETPRNPLSGKILRKVSISGLPGQVPSFQLGEKLKGEFEFQTNGHEELFEVRTTFSRTGNLEEATLKTGFTIQEGVPLVIHESRTGTKRKAWVMTARILALDHEIHDLLKRTEKGP